MGLKEKAVRGVAWTAVGSIGSGLLNFILTMILARLLSPSDYGLLELIAIFTILSEVFVDSGFSQAVIRDNDATNEDLSSVFFFNTSISVVLYVLLFFSAPLIANFYNEPKLINLSRFVFLTIIFYSASIIQNAIFTKDLKFKPQAIAAIASIILSGTTSVILAVKGFGVWALATNMVLFAFLKTVFLWVLSTWRPILKVSMRSIKKYFKFGVNLLLQGLLDKFISNFESLMIGKVYTKTDLGYFSQARKLDTYINNTTTKVIKTVSYPILAKLQHSGDNNNALKNGYRRVLGVSMFSLVPMMFFTAASADNFLFCVFGPQWGESAPYLRLWSFCGLMVSFYSIFLNVFMVKDRTKDLLKLSIIRQIARLIVIFALIKISVMALMYGILVTTFLAMFLYSYYGGKMINYKLREVFVDLLPCIIPALAGAALVYFMPLLLPIPSPYLMFAIQLVVMLSVYLFGCKMMKNPAYFEVKDILLLRLLKHKRE